MSTRLYIQLGRAGDILNLLPLLYDDHQRGEPSALMVAEEFAPMLEGCSYLTPIVFEGQTVELARAVEQASQLTGHQIIVSQVAGPADATKDAYRRAGQEHSVTDSFAKESWQLAGRMGDWKNQPPIVFDRRSPEREAKLLADLPKKKPLILVAADGVSSPFPYKPLLMELLRLRFGRTHAVVELPKAERLYDLLAVYEKAALLVASDSAPLHLAYAVKTLPVVALVNDKPSLWHGSPWRPNHIFHCRYADFPHRAPEMLQAINNLRLNEGSRFNPYLTSPKIIHVWNGYEGAQGQPEWREEYGNSWVACPIEKGALGRDSKHSSVKDTERWPFLKDALRLACLRADNNDILCLTRPDTLLPAGLTNVLLADHPCYARRTILSDKGDHKNSYHPSVDLLAFTKAWWREHQSELPDLIMSRDVHWPRILSELLKQHGGKELPLGSVYQKNAITL